MTNYDDLDELIDQLTTNAANGLYPKPLAPPSPQPEVTAERRNDSKPAEYEYQPLDELLASIPDPEPERPADVKPLEPVQVGPQKENWAEAVEAITELANQAPEIKDADKDLMQNLSGEVISFVVDYPDLVPDEFWAMTKASSFIDEDSFVFTILHAYHEEHGVVPTRAVLREMVGKALTFNTDADIDRGHRILAIVDRPSNPREIDFIAKELINIVKPWVERRHRLSLAAKVMEINRAVEDNDAIDFTTTLLTMCDDFRAMVVGSENEQDTFTWGELVEKYPEREPPVIDGLVREGQIANLVSSSKEGKSWMTYGLAFSVIAGKKWLGTFPTTKGKVLIVDNELSREELSHRTRKVATAMGINTEDAKDLLVIKTLKQKPKSLSALAEFFNRIKPHEYRLIILDAMYKYMEDKTDENSNADIGRFYAMLGEYAASTKSAILLVHHSTKGNQSEKKITDVGSGAGAQSRAADCHIIFREHEEDGAMVLDAKVRSFQPVEPVVVRFQWPLWEPDHDLDPSQLATTTRRQQKDRDDQGTNAIRTELEKLPADLWVSASELEKRTSMGYRRIEKLLYQMPEVESKATKADGKGVRYRLGPVGRRQHCDGITTDDGTATVIPVASPKRATTTTGTDDGGTGLSLEGRN